MPPALRRLALALALVAASASARADEADVTLAREHYATGKTYFETGRFREAAREFEEAYRLSKLPAFLFNIGYAYERLDDPGRAVRAYQRYLAAVSDAPERVDIESKLFRLSQRAGKVIVRAPAGVEVFVDGEDLGAAPVDPLVVSEGKHGVEVRRPGALPGLRDVEVKGGLSVEVTVEPTEIAPATPPVAAPAPVAAPVAAPAPAASKRPGWLWPVLGVAAVVVVGGAVAVGVTAATSVDYAAGERSACMAGCQLIDFGGGH